ncbi:glycoside hydrolase family 99-like domain-containing protein [Pseudoxanthomonas sp. X-1]|uniref:glycoside hydrolase family 99-like domain-containing protein n=1 Tax=Pseudoxanthomonas sp. X-1 TaxID=2571115 RepID=UPI00110B62F3|nr:glycoside hydrolase family 99-like domain-containing protein [Pseudoxanthomonas sp. X-1]TMN19285.1 hypothetical protein FF950_11885 [Pseudoxanthomonas sp. X-1]UAY74141.1 glycoside hydrolase family 99-like domain-containing protein [Pseudoxanthomonas sp. X-1]
MSISSSGDARSRLFIFLRAVFRRLPLSTHSRDVLRNRFLERFPRIRPELPRAHAAAVGTGVPLRAPGSSDQPAIGHVPQRSGAMPEARPARLVAFYLPQFHPIPENDRWWGTGFTEWRNTARALPQFEGHSQPRVPADLGYYDLRSAQVLRAQAALAQSYGIEGFCSYFYWFAGHVLLEAPLRNWLEHEDIALPLCLCWANENWTRTWSGRGQDVLIGQRHSAADDLAFIAYIAPYLRDPRYLRIDGRPMLLVYRPGLLPDAAATAERWRHWCRENGVGELHLAYVQSFERPTPESIGFDAAVEFPPNLTSLPTLAPAQTLLNPDYAGEILDWRVLARNAIDRDEPGYLLYPGVNPGWDNEPRRPSRGRSLLHASPRGYRDWLRRAIQRVQSRPASQRLVFVNAWNEWAEGAVLEPDARLGHAWLDATRQALHPAKSSSPSPVAIIHAFYPEVLREILEALLASTLQWRVIVTTSAEKLDAVNAVIASSAMGCEVRVYENRGRDILPFLHVADALLNEGVDVVLKLHTKRSVHRRDGAQWRQEVIDRLTSPARASIILDAYRKNPRLGLVAPEGHTPRLSFYWGANADSVARLASVIGIPPVDVEEDRFIAGSMFWTRLEALRPLLDAHLDTWRFEREVGQVDGTTAHAIERLTIVVAKAAGYATLTASTVAGDHEPDPDAHYSYAQPS